MRVYGVDPERAPVTYDYDVKCPLCNIGDIRIALRLGESIEWICPHCEERVVIQWTFDEMPLGAPAMTETRAEYSTSSRPCGELAEMAIKHAEKYGEPLEDVLSGPVALAVEAIVQDITDRRGIKHAWRAIDG